MIFDHYKHIELAQTPGAKELIADLIQNFDCIIEIGSLYGGLSLWINDNKKNTTEFISFDINDSVRWHQQPQPDGSENINFLLMDCFSDDAQNIIKQKLEKFKTLLICDGGNKNQEFNYYSQFLTKNSCIMLHDYIDDTIPEYWDDIAKNKDWTAPPESKYSQIKYSIDSFGLAPFRYREFLDVFWGLFIKK